MEYLEDLHYYYKSGYGAAINENIQCAAVADMMKHLESKEQPQVVSYFTHSSAVQLLLVALGIAKDREALRADNYLSNSRRRWKSSEIGPFGANLAVIKYDCPSDTERVKIMFFLNEKPVDLDWCRVGLCNWSDVKQHYEKFQSGNCDQTYCGGNTGNSTKFTIFNVFLPLTISYALYKMFR